MAPVARRDDGKRAESPAGKNRNRKFGGGPRATEVKVAMETARQESQTYERSLSKDVKTFKRNFPEHLTSKEKLPSVHQFAEAMASGEAERERARQKTHQRHKPATSQGRRTKATTQQSEQAFDAVAAALGQAIKAGAPETLSKAGTSLFGLPHEALQAASEVTEKLLATVAESGEEPRAKLSLMRPSLATQSMLSTKRAMSSQVSVAQMAERAAKAEASHLFVEVDIERQRILHVLDLLVQRLELALCLPILVQHARNTKRNLFMSDEEAALLEACKEYSMDPPLIPTSMAHREVESLSTALQRPLGETRERILANTGRLKAVKKLERELHRIKREERRSKKLANRDNRDLLEEDTGDSADRGSNAGGSGKSGRGGHGSVSSAGSFGKSSSGKSSEEERELRQVGPRGSDTLSASSGSESSENSDEESEEEDEDEDEEVAFTYASLGDRVRDFPHKGFPANYFDNEDNSSFSDRVRAQNIMKEMQRLRAERLVARQQKRAKEKLAKETAAARAAHLGHPTPDATEGSMDELPSFWGKGSALEARADAKWRQSQRPCGVANAGGDADADTSARRARLDPRVARLLDALWARPLLRQAIKKFLLPKISLAGRVFLEYAQGLRQCAEERLQRSPAEEAAREERLRRVYLRNQEAADELKRLEEQLEEARRNGEEELKKRAHDVDLYERRIEAMCQRHKTEMTKTENASERNMVMEWKNSQLRQMALEKELEEMETQLRDLQESNLDGEKDMRQRRARLEHQLKAVIATYDHDMMERQVQLDKVTDDLKLEREKLEELQELIKLQQDDYERMMAERGAMDEEELQQAIFRFICNRAAKVIQRAYRAYLAWKHRAKKKGKKKKKG